MAGITDSNGYLKVALGTGGTVSGAQTFTGLANFSSGLRTKYSAANVSDPPTDAELDVAFGTPVALGSGFVGVLDDNSAGTDCYLVWTTGTDAEWFWAKGTKAL